MSKPKKPKIQKTSYTQNISDARLLDLSKECGKIYSKALVFFNRVWFKKGIWLSEKSVRRYFEKVSSHNRLDVVGGLTPPRGWQYKPQLLCLVGSIRTRRTPRHPLAASGNLRFRECML